MHTYIRDREDRTSLFEKLEAFLVNVKDIRIHRSQLLPNSTIILEQFLILVHLRNFAADLSINLDTRVEGIIFTGCLISIVRY